MASSWIDIDETVATYCKPQGEVCNVECHEFGAPCGQGEAQQQQGSITFTGEVSFPARGHGEHLVGGRRGFLDRCHAECPPRPAQNGVDPLVVGWGCEPRQRQSRHKAARQLVLRQPAIK
jgi:hypothetical protein